MPRKIRPILVKNAGHWEQPEAARPYAGPNLGARVVEVRMPETDVWRPAKPDLGADNPERYVFVVPAQAEVVWRGHHLRDALMRYAKPIDASPDSPFQIQVWLAGEWLNTQIVDGELAALEPRFGCA